MNTPKVSVIIPVYNTEAYIEESLRCIMNQTLKEIEIIVINDGSTDGSLTIINELLKEDTRMVVWSQPNQGQSVARNAGMEKATGEFIYFMDSDDLLLPETLDCCYEKCVKDNLDFIFFDGDIFCEDGQPSLLWDYHRTKGFLENKTYDGVELFNTMLDTATHRAVPWLLLIRKRFMDDISLRFYPGIIHEDELFTSILYLEASRVSCLKQNFAKHRVRGSSTMTTKYSYRNVDCYFTVILQLLRYAKIKDERIQKIVDKFAAYTLNPVFQTAYSLPLKDRLKALVVAIRCGYLKYIKRKSLLVLLLKKYK